MGYGLNRRAVVHYRRVYQIQIVCDNVACKIVGGVPDTVNEAVSDACSFPIQNADKIIAQDRRKPPRRRRYHKIENGQVVQTWDGKKRLYHRGHHTFPAGLLSRVRGVLDELGVEHYVRRDVEPVGRIDLPEVDPEYEAREYQQRVVIRAVEEVRCMVRVATGGGKTIIAGHIIGSLKLPTLFLVHTKDLLYQAKNMFMAMFGPEYVGQIGDGYVDPGSITIATIQTVSRALGVGWTRYEYEEGEDQWDDDETDHRDRRVKETLRRAGLVFMDECHRVAAPTATEVMESIEYAHYRIGLSASPWRDDGADLQLEAAFGEVIGKISASELYRRDWLVRPVIRVLDLPAMYFDKKTRYQSVYKEYIVENEDRNRLGAEQAARMMNEGRAVLILVRYIKHGEEVKRLLREEHGIEIPFLQGDDPASVRGHVLDRIRDETLGGVIATTIADEGLDVKPLSGLVLLGGGKSSVRALQRVGRVLRPWSGKEYAEVIDFNDQAKYLWRHTEARVAMYQEEPEWVITDV